MITVLNRPTGSNPGSGGGLGTSIFLVPKSYLVSQPKRDVTSPNKIIADLAFDATNAAIEIYCTKETIEPTFSKLAGENADCGGVENSIKISHPSISADVLQFIAENGFGEEGYVFVKNERTGVIYIIGEDGFTADMSDFAGKIGKTIADSTSVEITFTAKQPLPFAIFEGGGVFGIPVAP